MLRTYTLVQLKEVKFKLDSLKHKRTKPDLIINKKEHHSTVCNKRRWAVKKNKEIVRNYISGTRKQKTK